ncbi:MAG: hypothetical protein H6Q05_2609 [Acidobacteria bacterium]|jgi:hypothetical protein|nr:hypothetical protein [Acidobacteriota bacterium]
MKSLLLAGASLAMLAGMAPHAYAGGGFYFNFGFGGRVAFGSPPFHLQFWYGHPAGYPVGYRYYRPLVRVPAVRYYAAPVYRPYRATAIVLPGRRTVGNAMPKPGGMSQKAYGMYVPRRYVRGR